MLKRLLSFNSVFAKLFASVMLALILFALAMVLMTHLVHDTSANTRHQILASQVTQQIDPLLMDLRTTQIQKQRLENRYLLALIRRSFNVYGESLNARFALYDIQTQKAVVLMEDMPKTLPPKPSWFSTFFPHDDPKHPIQVQIYSQSGYAVLYESNQSNKPAISPALNLVTGTLLLLFIMAGVLWIIAKTMTWRINQLSRQITQFGEGNFSARVTPVGNDEITTLANGFNRAAERIESLMNANKLLLAHASHEIRTPITRIRLQVEMMDMLANHLEQTAQEKFHKRADAINRDLTGLNNLVESILLVSRLDAGHALEKVENIDLFELIKGEVQHYPQVTLNGYSIHIQGQPSLLTHLIRNLLDNAHLHGEPPVQVYLYAIDDMGHRLELPRQTQKTTSTNTTSNNQSSEENITEKNKEKDKKSKSIFSRKKTDNEAETLHYSMIQIAVIDQGKGVPEDKRQEIFSPFVRLKQEKKGSGLGLSLVSQIVNAHQGNIITDTLDGKTRFLVTLPTKQPS